MKLFTFEDEHGDTVYVNLETIDFAVYQISGEGIPDISLYQSESKTERIALTGEEAKRVQRLLNQEIS